MRKKYVHLDNKLSPLPDDASFLSLSFLRSEPLRNFFNDGADFILLAESLSFSLSFSFSVATKQNLRRQITSSISYLVLPTYL